MAPLPPPLQQQRSPSMAERTTTATTNGGTASSSTKNINQQVEVSKADRHVWLMKCPAVASRFLQASPDTNNTNSGPVAKVIVTVDPLLPSNDFSSTQFTMEMAGTASGNGPKCFSMDMSADFVPMSVFSESSQGRLSVEGKIYHKFDMRPDSENFEDYGKLCRERTNKYMTKTRQIQVIDDDNGKHMRPMPGIVASKVSSVGGEKRKMPAKGSEMKRIRRDRDEMEEIMFKLFERQPNWTLKQLIQETDQPEQFLKDMLRNLCVYNNKGANQGTYELKPEYKRSEEEPDS